MDRSELTFRLNAYPAAVFVDILHEVAEPLGARALKDHLEAMGFDRSVVDGMWKRAQPGVKRHGNVAFDATRGLYRWREDMGSARQ
ncbi:MAG: hypothetical protein QOE61_117 [Micromonosporaceae bacterium]|nr:hypothetical protein [Micromonosporaceae bacterium]